MSTVPVPEVAEQSDPARVLPTITLTEEELEYVELHTDARSGTGYNNEDAAHNSNYGERGESRLQHLKGLMGEVGASKYFDGTAHHIDEEITRSGDNGEDIVFHRDDVEYDSDDYEDGKIVADVKAVKYGYSKNLCPLLKICREKHEAAPNRIYILVEIVNRDTVRVIGYIHSELVEAVADEVDKGEVYKPDNPRKKFTSSDDNYVVDPEETAAFQAVWREWSEDDV